jgi:hypothetical protein
MNIHKGKIGRLPATIRDQLNQRMFDGESASTLLPWLNALPVVQALLAARFSGEPVSEQNLSNWRAGGYVQWHKQRERRATVQELAGEDQELDTGSVARETVLNQRLSRVLTADFAVAARELLVNLTDPAERCQRLQEFLHTLKYQRREDYLTERLKIEIERRDRERLAEQEQDDVARENAPWVRQLQRGEIDRLFETLDFTSQAQGVQESESLLRSLKPDAFPADSPASGPI